VKIQFLDNAPHLGGANRSRAGERVDGGQPFDRRGTVPGRYDEIHAQLGNAAQIGIVKLLQTRDPKIGIAAARRRPLQPGRAMRQLAPNARRRGGAAGHAGIDHLLDDLFGDAQPPVLDRFLRLDCQFLDQGEPRRRSRHAQRVQQGTNDFLAVGVVEVQDRTGRCIFQDTNGLDEIAWTAEVDYPADSSECEIPWSRFRPITLGVEAPPMPAPFDGLTLSGERESGSAIVIESIRWIAR